MSVLSHGDGWCVQQAAYDALAARLAEAERDAARYRWLRFETIHGNPPLASIVWKANGDRNEYRWVNSSSLEQIDNTIDRAIGATPSANLNQED